MDDWVFQEIKGEFGMKKIKAYITYSGSPDFWTAQLIFENGWSAFSHLCSSVRFMEIDLWEKRDCRQKILEQMGYEVEIVGEPDPGGKGLPAWLLEKHNDESNYADFRNLYNETEKRLKDDLK